MDGLLRKLEVYFLDIASGRAKGFFAYLLKAMLFVLSFIYGIFIKLLLSWYSLKPYRAACRVISVGNITLGGTGKTMIVEYIADYLKTKGIKVVVLSRGYKRKMPHRQAGELPVTSYETMGDEPYMLSQNLVDIPVISGPDRIKSINEAVAGYSAQAVIIDDGFQQWKIRKDLDIVAIDATSPFGDKTMIPCGLLREPLSSLGRADIFVITKSNLTAESTDKIRGALNKINPRALIVVSEHHPIGFYDLYDQERFIEAQAFHGQSVACISAIGDPSSFEALVKSLNIHISLSFRFSDHHNYSEGDLRKIFSACNDKGIGIIVVTQKDAVKIERLNIKDVSLRIIVLRLKLKITDSQEDFLARLS